MTFIREDVKRGLFSGQVPGSEWHVSLFLSVLLGYSRGDLCDMVLNYVNQEIFLRKFNFTVITLIPKVPNPVDISQFRPIALCNTTTKLVAKVLVERLKKVFGTIVSETQSAFVPNRLIKNNILLAYEVSGEMDLDDYALC
ncbi:hypothetical protein LIER_42154 [Lithospermum erythrorhizon]|uniref:Reverse transcriptase n=1 Tax=Lithospermum erythrorhizon TaxID=34254 RepID=A0AAV3RNW4_LITER